ncbi:MAG: lamin tail domain-containing protein, partial [Opitutaceae bacterium]|nr:lamin tail domain-containing protein [Verrucomicrobiales bacterium]
MNSPWKLVISLCFLVLMTSGAADSNIVLNELMYHPSQDREDLQYVELYNRGTNTVDVSRWSFSKGVAFTFPENTRLAPDSYLVVARNVAEFKNYYGRSILALGNFTGRLSHKGDRVELSDSEKKIVDWVKYSDSSGWPTAPDGYSSSLERISPNAADNGPANWAGSKLPAISRPAGTPGKRNDSYSANLPPAFTNVTITPLQPKPGEKVTIEVTVADADGVKDVKLMHRTVTPGRLGAEATIVMNRISGDTRRGVYQGVVAGQPGSVLSRVRLAATDEKGTTRLFPSPTEPAPALSYYTFSNTNTAKIAFGFVLSSGKQQERGNTGRFGRPSSETENNEPTSGQDAFIYVPPDGASVQVFDHVRVTSRKGGFKVRFLKDNKLKDMSTVNIIFEGSPRWILSEPLAYDLYRLAGVPAELTEHIRINYDGQWRGLQLLIEQPNRSF